METMTSAQFRSRLMNTGKNITLVPEKGKKSKYGNIKTVVDGITFDSKREADFYNKLLVAKRGGVVTNIELQPKFTYKRLYCRFDQIDPIISKKETYISDFKVTFADGHVEIVDCKGTRTAIFNRKKKIVEQLFGITIMLV